MNRRAYIDWLRGLAVVIMIEAHTVDAWTVDDPAVRGLWQYKRLQFIAGWAAPLFLMLAGVSVALAVSAHLRKGRTIREAGGLVEKRGWEVFGMAFLFRLQSFLLSPTQHVEALLKVDILNIMGLAMVASAWCWSRAETDRQRAQWLLGGAGLCVLIGQFTPVWSWPLWFGDTLQGYFRSVPGTGNFMFFPWAGFVFFGTWLGGLLLVNRDVAADRRFHLGLGAVGVLAVLVGLAGTQVPELTPHSTFWLESTSFFLIRVGAMTAMLSGAWIWMQRPRAGRWSPMVVFGQTSLFVYWVHVEIVYGFPTIAIRYSLSIRDALIAYAAFTIFMLWLAVKWNQRTKGPLIPDYLRTSNGALTT